MDCHKAEKLISLYFDGEIKPNDIDLLIEHTQSCIKCKENFKFFSKVFNSISKTSEIEPDPYFFTKVREKIREDNKKKSIFFHLLIPSGARNFITSILIFCSFAIGFIFAKNYTEKYVFHPYSTDGVKSAFNIDVVEDLPEDIFTSIYNNGG